MLEGLGNLTTSCTHIDPGDSGCSISPASKEPRQTANSNSIALVAVGNSLIQKDCRAASLLTQMEAESDICKFFLDGSPAWLREVLNQHAAVIIMDSVEDFQGGTNGTLTVPLTGEVLAKSGFCISSTHGLSWLDEIKFYQLERQLPQHLIFFGIDASLSDVEDGGVLKGELEEAIVFLRNHRDSIVATGGTHNA